MPSATLTDEEMAALDGRVRAETQTARDLAAETLRVVADTIVKVPA